MADYENESIHLGFIIVDPAIRGKGYGKEMLRLVIKYAFEILNVSRITLGVFDNNPAAHYCYKAAGFVDEKYYAEVFPYKDEKWGVYDMVIDKAQE
jgi:RimJ/RimL family protein N-acetyltransferase